MRILDYFPPRQVADICLLLTPEEVVQLIGYLEQLLESKTDHYHLLDTRETTRDGVSREITVALYDGDKLDVYDPVTRQLLEEGI
ncbi:MAG: hypothetical protein ABL962_10140 [Fimbriimonadaceae bacterium]